MQGGKGLSALHARCPIGEDDAMTLWVCRQDGVAYSVDAPHCPHCGANDPIEQGSEDDMGKIAKEGGATVLVGTEGGTGDGTLLDVAQDGAVIGSRDYIAGDLLPEPGGLNGEPDTYEAGSELDRRPPTDAELAGQLGGDEDRAVAGPAPADDDTDDDGEPVDQDESDTDAEPVPDGSAREVLAWVGSDQKRAARAFAAERDRPSPRSGLMNDLQKLFEN